MKDQIQTEKNFIETLGIMAELFMVLGVVAPIFFIVILAMMSMLGGSGNPNLLMAVLVYIIIPVAELIIIVLIDAQQPEM